MFWVICIDTVHVIVVLKESHDLAALMKVESNYEVNLVWKLKPIGWNNMKNNICMDGLVY